VAINNIRTALTYKDMKLNGLQMTDYANTRLFTSASRIRSFFLVVFNRNHPKDLHTASIKDMKLNGLQMSDYTNTRLPTSASRIRPFSWLSSMETIPRTYILPVLKT